MSDGKRYEIEKIEDILVIPEESFDDFLVDLKEYYNIQHDFKKLAKDVEGIFGEGSIRTESKFIWIDDGKHERKVTVKVETEKKKPE
jgi:hypothetical protein